MWPSGYAEKPLKPRACRWSAAIVEGAHLVPFRTQKLSPPAPMVLSGKPMEEQDVADLQWARNIKGALAACRGSLLFLYSPSLCAPIDEAWILISGLKMRLLFL